MKNLLNICKIGKTDSSLYFKREDNGNIFCLVKKENLIHAQNLHKGEKVILPNKEPLIEQAIYLQLKVYTLTEYPDLFQELDNISLPDVFNIPSELVRYIKDISTWNVKGKAFYLLSFEKEDKYIYSLFNNNGSETLTTLKFLKGQDKDTVIRLLYQSFTIKS